MSQRRLNLNFFSRYQIKFTLCVSVTNMYKTTHIVIFERLKGSKLKPFLLRKRTAIFLEPLCEIRLGSNRFEIYTFIPVFTALF